MTQTVLCPSSELLITLRRYFQVWDSHVERVTAFKQLNLHFLSFMLFSCLGHHHKLLWEYVFFTLFCFRYIFATGKYIKKSPEGNSFSQCNLTKFWSSYLLLLLVSVAQVAMSKTQGEDLGRATACTLSQKRTKFKDLSLKTSLAVASSHP